jgi:hypothetical protein
MEEVCSPSSADDAFDMIENLSAKVKNAVHTADEFLQLQQKWETGKQFAAEHPVATLFLVVLSIMCIIPVVCFCFFAICTTITLIGACLLCEAFLLTIGAVILIGILSFIAFITLGFSAVVSLAVYSVIGLRKLVLSLTKTISSHGIQQHTD